MNKEINILGGGISGLACAIILRKNEYKVNVYEKSSYVGKRFNEDWQGLENWSEKTDVLKQIESYGIDLSFEYEPISELAVHYSGKMQTAKVKNGCYLVRRGSKEGCLDKALLEQAEKLGVKIHFNYRQEKELPVQVNATGPRNATAFVRGIKFNTKLRERLSYGFWPGYSQRVLLLSLDQKRARNDCNRLWTQERPLFGRVPSKYS